MDGTPLASTGHRFFSSFLVSIMTKIDTFIKNLFIFLAISSNFARSLQYKLGLTLKSTNFHTSRTSSARHAHSTDYHIESKNDIHKLSFEVSIINPIFTFFSRNGCRLMVRSLASKQGRLVDKPAAQWSLVSWIPWYIPQHAPREVSIQ